MENSLIDAMVISALEPQLDRCLKSVNEQTVPFYNIVHVDNVAPEYLAWTQALEQTKSEWAVCVNGDMILIPNAVEICLQALKKHNDKKIFVYGFALYDTFLRRTISCCKLIRTDVYKSRPYRDQLCNDDKAILLLRRGGWIVKNFITGPERIVIGTHFEEPDDFQVFRRFYARAMKKDSKWMINELNGLRIRHKHSHYELALQSFLFGKKEAVYPGSHNIEFDKTMYKKFLKEKDGILIL